MTKITESSIDTTVRKFQHLLSQLSSEKYPITSKTIKESDNRLKEYFKRIIENDIHES